MSDASNMEEILSRVREEEKQYEWLKAADYYLKALNMVAETDPLRRGEIKESLARALYRAAFQADSGREFKERMVQAVACYEETRSIYDGSEDARKAPRILRCSAMIAFAGHWLVVGSSERKARLEESWNLTMKALDGFEGLAECLEYGRTYNELSRSVDILLRFEWDYQVREKVNKQAADYGEKSIRLLSSCGEARELARAYMKTGIFLYGIENPHEQETLGGSQKVADYRIKAGQLSQVESALEFVWVPGVAFQKEIGDDSTLSYLMKALEFAKTTRDRFVLGGALEMLAFHTVWKSYACGNPEEKVELLKRALQFAEDAKRQFSPLGYVSAGQAAIWTESPYDAYYSLLASVEVDLRERRGLLNKALDSARDRLKKSEDSGYPGLIAGAHHRVSLALKELAKVEPDPLLRKKLLEEALGHQTEAVKMSELLGPFDYYTNAIYLNGLANTKLLLADLVKDPEAKRSIVREVVVDREKSLSLCLRRMDQFGDFSAFLYSQVGSMQYGFGESLSRLYSLTGDGQLLQKAIEAFSAAAESFRKPMLLSRVAECRWKVAAVNDAVGEYRRAAKNFELASNDFTSAAEKIPQLADFYRSYGLYMQAWSEIEKARYHHSKGDYGPAESHFREASELHESLKQWSYLASNYTAWARVSHAEELSRRDRSEEALEVFQEAGRLFDETRRSLEARVTTGEGEDEKGMVASLVGACEVRCEYCEARASLEQARVFEKRGDHELSAEKCGEAVDILESVVKRVESEQDRRELQFMIGLSRAWQRMAQAEAETAPALYLEASRLFEEAKVASPSEKAKLLMMGHSRFCRALEAGARFADTRDAALHAAAKQDLESAMDYYLKADFGKASEYAKATGLLLDAYLYIGDAAKESDPEKKAKLYMMTERVLQASAGLYVNADNSAKSEQVHRLLDNVREQRELAVSLTEVLHAPLVGSTTVFPSPTPTYERAVGLEGLEHAQVQANIIPDRRELRVSEVLDLEIELVNPGKGVAVLDKIAEAFPESFELVERPQVYRVEGCNVNMKGKRLDPLRAEEVRLRLKPRRKGLFTVEPRILYLDENGNTRLHQPEPITVTVKELGIRDWIKGSG